MTRRKVTNAQTKKTEKLQQSRLSTEKRRTERGRDDIELKDNKAKDDDEYRGSLSLSLSLCLLID